MSSSKPHKDGVAEPVDTSRNPLQPAVEEIRLERFEFGKPCVEVDGNVVFKGNRPAEYQPLYQTSFFSQQQRAIFPNDIQFCFSDFIILLRCS